MNIRPSSWLLAILATATCIGLILLATDCDAAEDRPILRFHLDPTYVTPGHSGAADGDSITLEINKRARVWLDSSIKDTHYFEVYKNGFKIATVMPKEKNAIILHGNYKFIVKSMSDDNILATIHVHSKLPGLGSDFRQMLFWLSLLVLAMIIALIVTAINILRRRRAERIWREKHPPVITEVKWHKGINS